MLWNLRGRWQHEVLWIFWSSFISFSYLRLLLATFCGLWQLWTALNYFWVSILFACELISLSTRACTNWVMEKEVRLSSFRLSQNNTRNRTWRRRTVLLTMLWAQELFHWPFLVLVFGKWFGLLDLQEMSFQLLDSLLEGYYDYSMETLVSKSKIPNESTRCSQSLAQVAKEFHWSNATFQKYMRLLKLILKETTADANFIVGLRIIKEQQPFNRVLGKRF